MRIIKALFLVSLPYVGLADIVLSKMESDVLEKDNAKKVNLVAFEKTSSGNWSATTDVDWIYLMRSSGTEKESLRYKVTTNLTTDVRSGRILVNGQTFTVHQAAYDATITSAYSGQFPAAGGEETVAFIVNEPTSGDHVAWTARTDAEWITFASDTKGLSGGAVKYRVAKNQTAEGRTNVLIVAGQSLTVIQDPSEPEEEEDEPVATVRPDRLILDAHDQVTNILVEAAAKAAWQIQDPPGWVQLVNHDLAGVGTETITVHVPENQSVNTRTAVLTIGGFRFTVIQKGTVDYVLETVPDGIKAPFSPTTTSVQVRASQDLDWLVPKYVKTAAGVTMAEVQSPKSLSSTGADTLRYTVYLNNTVEPRNGVLELSAKIPQREIELSRGLMKWRGTEQALGYAFDSAALRDAEVAGETEGIWFVITDHMDSLHRLFDLNGGIVSLYVTESNRLVLDDAANDVIDLNFPVEQGVKYDLFVASSATNAVLYGGVHDGGTYRKLYECADVLKVSAYGRSTKPSNTTGATELVLEWGDAAKSPYYYWTRALSSNEMLNMPTAKPEIAMPSGSAYNGLYSYAPMDRQFIRTREASETALVVGDIVYGQSRELLAQRGMSGSVISPNVAFRYSNYSYRDSYYSYSYVTHYLFTTTTSLKSLWAAKPNYGLHEDIAHAVQSASYSLWIKINVDSASDVDLFEMMRLSYASRVYLDDADLIPMSYKGQYKLQCASAGLRFVENGVASQYFAKDEVVFGKWMMLTVTSNGSVMTLYVNGKDVGNIALNGYPHFCLDGWCAYGNDGSVFFDSVKTFDTCLATKQVNEIYEREKPIVFRHVIQQGAAVPELSSTGDTFGSASAGGSVSVTLPNRVEWKAFTTNDWISLSASGGTGSATITFALAKNPETHERVGTIMIAGMEYRVVQKGTGVSFDRTIYKADYYGNGLLSPIVVHAEDSDTHWVAEKEPDAEWLYLDGTLDLAYDGWGTSELPVDVGECSGMMNSQIGVVTVAGTKIFIYQRDFDLCVFPPSKEVSHAGETSAVEIETEDGYDTWVALTDVDWIVLSDAIDGRVISESGELTYTLLENTTDADRVGRIIIAGETCVITQKTKGVAVSLEIGGPDAVLTGVTTNYTAQLVYSSGWRETVTPTWEVLGNSTAVMNSDGSFVAGAISGVAHLNATYVLDGKEYRSAGDKRVTITLRPVKLEIFGSASPLCQNESRSLAYQVTYTDGTTDLITPTQVAVTSGIASVDDAGVLTAGEAVGTVSLSATYSIMGETVSAIYDTSVVNPTISQVLESDLDFNLGGWRAVGGEHHTGDYAMKSGPLTTGQVVELSSSVTGAGTLSCWLKSSTAADANVACGELLVDGVVVSTLKGVTDWTNVVCTVSTWGSHKIVWRYRKTVAGDYGEDCIWLDDVTWTATAVAPVSLTVQGSDRVVVAQTTQYACTAQYNDGSSRSVTASWSVVSGTDCAEINGTTGLLTARKDGSVRIQASYTEKDVTKTATFDVTVVKGLVSISISGLSKLYAGDSSTYVCTATYTDGSSAAVSANWTLTSGGNCASINSSGLLTALDADGEATVKASYTYEGMTKTATHTVQIVRQIAVSSETTGGKAFNVPVSWTRKYPKFKTQYGQDLAAAMSVPTGKKDGAHKPLKVWDDYVAGTDPTDEKDVLRAKVEMVDGLPHVSWEPNLNEDDVTRTYKVYGRRSLSGSDAWEHPANSAVHQFFKVDVAMPDDNDGGSDAPGEVESWRSVAIPTAVSGLVYDGTVKQGVLSGTGYVLSGASATAANTYTAYATLSSGYRWSNGQTTGQQIPWSIAKAENAWLSLPTMSSTSFEKGSSVTLTKGAARFGTVIANYTATDLAALTAGSYFYTCYVNGTGNYTGVTKTIPFTVTSPATLIAAPSAKTGLSYTGSTQYGVPSGTGYTLTGNSAINAGSYTATATLKDGYAWSDGTTSKSRAISWSISKATNSWLTQPSLSSTEFAEGTAVTISMGAVKFGVRQANYTASELAGLPAGSYTLVVSVEGTSNYTGLTKSIPFTVTGEASSSPLYCVVDLSGGSSAKTYSVEYLDTLPSEGWGDEHKTTKLVLRRIAKGSYSMLGVGVTTISKGFYVGVFEVTQKQYELVMGSQPASGYGIGDSYPVYNVSYDDIRGTSSGRGWPNSSAVDSSSFLGKLRARTSLNFDLPTEAQWEYACRAGTTGKYYWSAAGLSTSVCAWYISNSSYATHNVGLKRSNDWGLFDMSGNVSEWCLDWYSSSLSYGTDPKGPSSATYNRRVTRGGCYSSGESDLRMDDRIYQYGVDASTRSTSVGFRVIMPE